jgi:hypothetical protein
MIPITSCASRYEADLAGYVSLFQVQWIDAISITLSLRKYLVKGQHLYSGT